MEYASLTQTIDTDAKLADILEGVRQEVNMWCGCGLTQQDITLGEFQCLSNPQEVTYRAKIRETTAVDSSEIVSSIEQWITIGTPALHVQGETLEIDSSCLAVTISSSTDTECGFEPDDGDDDDDATAFIVAHAVVSVFSAVSVVGVIVCVLLRSKNAKKKVNLGEFSM